MKVYWPFHKKNETQQNIIDQFDSVLISGWQIRSSSLVILPLFVNEKGGFDEVKRFNQYLLTREKSCPSTTKRKDSICLFSSPKVLGQYNSSFFHSNNQHQHNCLICNNHDLSPNHLPKVWLYISVPFIPTSKSTMKNENKTLPYIDHIHINNEIIFGSDLSQTFFFYDPMRKFFRDHTHENTKTNRGIEYSCSDDFETITTGVLRYVSLLSFEKKLVSADYSKKHSEICSYNLSFKEFKSLPPKTPPNLTHLFSRFIFFLWIFFLKLGAKFWSMIFILFSISDKIPLNLSHVGEPQIVSNKSFFTYTGEQVYTRYHNFQSLLSFFFHSKNASHSKNAKRGGNDCGRGQVWNIFCLLLFDTLLGICFGTLFILYADNISQFVIYYVEKLNRGCDALTVWLMGWPAGFKVNTHLSNFFGGWYVYFLQNWSDLSVKVCLHLNWILQLIGVCGPLGLTFIITILFDLFSLTVFHVSCIYTISARAYREQLLLVLALWRSFRGISTFLLFSSFHFFSSLLFSQLGKKYNPLRKRVDNMNYHFDQSLLATIFFAANVFLIPTTFLYYLIFYLLRCFTSIVKYLPLFLINLLNTFPLYRFFCYLRDFTQIPDLQGTPYVKPIHIEQQLPDFSEKEQLDDAAFSPRNLNRRNVTYLRIYYSSIPLSSLFKNQLQFWGYIFKKHNPLDVLKGFFMGSPLGTLELRLPKRQRIVDKNE